MPTLIEFFNWGSGLQNSNPELIRQLSQMYSDLSYAINSKVSTYNTDGAQKPHVNPPANSDFNRNYRVGDQYVRTDTNSAWVMTSRTTTNAVTWTLIT